MRLLFRVLLNLYPRWHRDLFGDEMQAVFEQSAQERRLLGRGSYLRFVLSELAALVTDAMITRVSRATSTAEPSSAKQDLPEEVLEAQNRVSVNLNHLLFAISHHQFREARFYSDEERKAREDLRRVREKYGLGDPA